MSIYEELSNFMIFYDFMGSGIYVTQFLILMNFFIKDWYKNLIRTGLKIWEILWLTIKKIWIHSLHLRNTIFQKNYFVRNLLSSWTNRLYYECLYNTNHKGVNYPKNKTCKRHYYDLKCVKFKFIFCLLKMWLY